MYDKRRYEQFSLSSSTAAFEVLIATVINHLYNDGKIDAVTVAKRLLQFAVYEENINGKL